MKTLSQNRARPAYILSTVPKRFNETTHTTQYKTSTRPPYPHHFIPTSPVFARPRLPTATVTAPKQTVRVYTKADETPIVKLASSLASAFENDPVVRYMHSSSNADILSGNKIFMQSTLGLELSRPEGQTTIHVSEDDTTVAVWHHVNHWKMPFMMELMFMFAMFRSMGWRFFTVSKMFQNVEDYHPTEPHMHLFIIGTHPDSQGRGNGSKVISKMLEYCDREGIPAYLESSNENNLSFYRRHGFEVVRKIPGLPEDCPPIIGMWRDPKPVSDI